jgi:hypothetical protein
MITWLSLLLLSLAAFRLTRLIVYDKITGFIRAPFLEREENVLADGTVEEIVSYKGTGLRRWIGELLSCHWCVGVWVSIFLFFGFTYFPIIFMPLTIILAIAAFAAIIEVIVSYFI